MHFDLKFLKKGAVAQAALAASAFLAIIAVFGISILPDKEKEGVSMEIEPTTKVTTIGDTFDIHITVRSTVPVNVFHGELNFDHNVLAIRSIDYNTDMADLWAEEPWYSNGAGTMNFTGGTTRDGGFSGEGSLITVTFETLQTGKGAISLNKSRILLHDGLGTDADLTKPISTIITVDDSETSADKNKADQQSIETTYTVIKELPSTDLNSDGKQSMADISIFMLNIAGSDPKYDFNLDGEVNIKDLNILLDAK